MNFRYIGTPPEGTTTAVACRPVKGRYVYIHIASEDTALTLCEVAVYPVEPGDHVVHLRLLISYDKFMIFLY